MYEHKTFDAILEDMLSNVPDVLDKREGSVIYDALAPAAIELQIAYIELDVILQETFGDTASREFLIRRAKERGITPYPATKALVKAVFTPSSVDVPIGTRFNLNDLNYIVTSKIADGEYQLECETEGIDGNQTFGDLIPIDYVEGLETADITEVLIPAEDEEDTEDLRERYFSSFETKPYGGNKKDYEQKTNALNGVGSTKVTPIWNGGGTVRLTILDSNFDKATPTLIDFVQNEIDPTQDGNGLGIAPIGHIVTVDTPDEVTIDIATTLTFDEGYSFTNLETQINDVIDAYLLELRKEWAEQSQTVVRVAQIDTRILGIEGVVDIENTRINNLAENRTLGKYEIAVKGSVIND